MTAPSIEKSDKSLHGPNLVLDVENFGPIAKAKNIEFKPMTVFVGPSNTGKTYLAMLLHAVAQGIDASNRTTERYDPLGARLPQRFNHLQQSSIIEDFKVLGRMFSAGTTPDNEAWDQLPLSVFSDVSRSAIENQITDHRQRVADTVNNSIMDFFGVESLLDLLPQHRATIHMLPQSINLTFPSTLITTTVVGTYISESTTRLNVPPAYVDYRAMHELNIDDEQRVSFVSGVEELIAVNFADLFYVLPYTFYLPAGRTGYLHTRELLLDFGTGTANRSRITRATQDSIDLLNRARQRSKRDMPRRPTLKLWEPFRHYNVKRELADILEQSIIDGRISVDPTNGVPEIRYIHNSGLNIPISQASSMVNEFAPIALYLRNYLVNGDLLIIDEPEANLHPAAQQQMAAALAFMVRSGLRVLITTHSHYMVEQLSAFVNASKLDASTRKRVLSIGGPLGEEDIYLNEDETAVYSFEFSEEHGGSAVTEIYMGDEYEYGPDDHTDATVRQFNRLQSVLEARELLEDNELD